MLTDAESKELSELRANLQMHVDCGQTIYATKMVRLIELERKDALDEATRVHIYSAIIGECENLEHRASFLGNGHHLAQRLTEMIKDTLKDVR